MSDNKKIGTSARELVLLFFSKVELKYKEKDIMIAMKNTKELLKAGYTYDEIKSVIEYCVDNPPKKGIYSFGYITNQMNKVLTILKHEQKQQKAFEAIDKSKFSDYGLKEVSNKDKMKERELNIDTSIFD